MDAGIAAVLGAAVGAIGTGGAGVAAALIGRSQSRQQIQAESLRLLREPRKTVYVAYAEACRRQLEVLSSTRERLVIHLSTQAEDEAHASSLDTATSHVEEATSQEVVLEHLQAQVYIEGPRSVIDAATELGDALDQFLSAADQAVEAMQGGQRPEGLSEQLRELRSDTYRHYFGFLYEASDAVDLVNSFQQPE
ncbi:hypothetical protein ACH4U6_05785 [Streptomyces netropsis]|uniref:hypothetical protein n=1 Tax=Streptomyces netropsis TaxID=55404 RepID=UPI0037AD877C